MINIVSLMRSLGIYLIVPFPIATLFHSFIVCAKNLNALTNVLVESPDIK